MGKIPNFTDSEQFKTPKTDCLLKVYKDKEFISLDSRFVDLENSEFPATLIFVIHTATQFSSSTITVSAESVGGSTPGARVTWNTTIPSECVTYVAVNFRNESGILVATNIITSASQTEFIQTGLQCGMNYSITVVVAGEASDLGYSLQYGTVQVLVGGKAYVRF